MHFGNREYSKNGHRTILFKDPNAQQNRAGLSQTDLKKIEIIYGPECRARDRQEKIELCQSYPGVARKKRDAEDKILDNKEYSTKPDLDPTVTKSLRVNPNITPPPANMTDDISKTLNELGIDQEIQEIVELTYKLTAVALGKAREKYCNHTDYPITSAGAIKKTRKSSDILSIVEVVADYANRMVDDAVTNLTKFCEESKSIPIYQRQGCSWNSRDPRCRETYRSTKSGPVKHSTQHRPVYVQSTKHYGSDSKQRQYGRARNDSDDEIEKTKEPQTVRKKREDASTEKRAIQNDEVANQKIIGISETVTENSKKDNKDKYVAGEKYNDFKENNDKAITEHTGDAQENNQGVGEAAAREKVGEKTDVAGTNNEIKVKNDENVENKKNLRMGTQSPGLIRSQQNRRSGKRHRAKRTDVNPIDQEYDSMDAETERPRKQKHNIENKIKPAIKHYVADDEEEKLAKEDAEANGRDIKKGQIKKIISKIKDHKERSVWKHIDSPIEDDNIEKIEGEENETTEEHVTPKGKKRKKHSPIKEKQIATIAEQDEDESTPNSKSKRGKQKRISSSSPRTVKLSKKNEEFYRERRWPEGQVNYMIKNNNNYDLKNMRKSLAQVNSILKKKTCVTLNEITPGQANKYDDYIVLDNSPDYVTGRVGGKQKFGAIELFQGGQHRQHTAMMVMAMLGFYFEVARHDRDKYIRVHMRHVRPDKLHHFEMIRSDATLPLPYDYASATHPAWQFWRQLGRSGISTVATYKEKDPDGTVMKSLGQNKKLLSDIDIVKINSVYGIDCFQNQRAKIDTNLNVNNESVLVTSSV